jgi:hypothetical protein
MANEVKWTYAGQVTLEANGGSAASNIFVAANDTTLASGNHSNFPLADMVLSCNFSTGALAAGAQVNLYRQDLTIDGANGAPAPGTAFRNILVGVFPLDTSQATNATNYYICPNVPLSSACQFSIENGTAQSLIAGWTLKATPKTYIPGA